MTNYQRLQQLAQALAAANADVSELFARELAYAARYEKAAGMPLGIAVRTNSLTGATEIRGGNLEAYIEGEPAGAGWEERILLPPGVGEDRKTGRQDDRMTG